jgi:hypothetical protein
VWQGKIAEQFRQTFQNGYRLLAFQCFGVSENVFSASFNKAAMVAGDDLNCAIRDNSEGGIFVVVFNKILDGLPFVAVMLWNVAKCATLVNGFMVGFPPSINQDFSILT